VNVRGSGIDWLALRQTSSGRVTVVLVAISTPPQRPISTASDNATGHRVLFRIAVRPAVLITSQRGRCRYTLRRRRALPYGGAKGRNRFHQGSDNNQN
jgi:hypothetical protein